MNAGDAADQAIRQVEKMIKATERASRDFRLSKVSHVISPWVLYHFPKNLVSDDLIIYAISNVMLLLYSTVCRMMIR